MKYGDLPTKYLVPAEDVLLTRPVPDEPDWTHHPYMPEVVGDKIKVARAYVMNSFPRASNYYPRPVPVHIVETDAWWLDNDRSLLAIRCKWQCRSGDVWWKKNSSTIWYYERVHGEWIKRKLTSKDVAALMESIKTFQELDW